MDSRKVLEAIFYVLRTGIQWKALPKEKFGAVSSIHRYFMAWSKSGVFENMWKAGVYSCGTVCCGFCQKK